MNGDLAMAQTRAARIRLQHATHLLEQPIVVTAVGASAARDS